MLTAVEGYYNGSQIVMNEHIKLHYGQKVIITVLEHIEPKKKTKIDLRKYSGRGEKMFHGDADDYVKGLRSDDRV